MAVLSLPAVRSLNSLRSGVSGDKVVCAASTALNDLTSFSGLMLLLPTTLTSTRRIIEKGASGTPGTGWALVLNGTTGNLQFVWRRLVTGLSYITNDTPAALNTWRWVAWSADQAGTAGAMVRMYTAPFSGGIGLVESTMGTATDGIGAFQVDNATTVSLLNGSPFTLQFQGRCAFAALYGGVLTYSDFSQIIASSQLGLSRALGFWLPGTSGTGVVRDLTGRGAHGTITGAIPAPGVTLGSPRQSRLATLAGGAVKRVGTTYYVSNAASDLGNDSNDGLTSGTPWLTLSKLSSGSAFLGAGDTVSLKCGSYFEEQLTIKTISNLGGQSDNRLVFTSYGSGTRPIISGANVQTGWVFDQAVAGGDRYVITGVSAATYNYAFREDGTVGVGTITNLRSRTTIAAVTALNDWRYSSATAEFYVVVATGEVPGAGGITIHITTRSINITPTTGGESHVTLQNLICRFSNTTSSNTHSLEFDQDSVIAHNWLFDNILQEWGFNGISFGGQGTNTFSQTRLFTMTNCVFRYNKAHGAQIIYLSAGSTISGCDFSSNGRQGLGFGAVGSTVSDCTFNYNAGAAKKWASAESVQGYDAGIYVVGQEPPGAVDFYASGSNLIVDCSATGNGKKGFATDTLCDNNVFLNCLSTSNVEYGFFFEGGTDSGAYGNILYHCTAWGNLDAGFSVYNSHGGFTCKNCQFYGNAYAGNASDVTIGFIQIGWELHSGAIYKRTHMRWDPITFRTQGAGTFLSNAGMIPSAPGQYWWDSANEILYAWRTDSAAVTAGVGQPVWTMDYNNYTPSAERSSTQQCFNFFDATTSVITKLLATIQGLSQEAHGQQVDPLYVDKTHGDFRLLTGSPSIDAGVVLVGYNDGTGGSTIYQGAAPDIGYYEGGVTPAVITAAMGFVRPAVIRSLRVYMARVRRMTARPGTTVSTDPTQDTVES